MWPAIGNQQTNKYGLKFWDAAVSYTHLDVYKRQGRIRRVRYDAILLKIKLPGLSLDEEA